MLQEENRCKFETCSSSFTRCRRRLRGKSLTVTGVKRERKEGGKERRMEGEEGERAWKVTQQGVREFHWL